MLVGQAMTGTRARPPTTLASAASMPATTIIASAPSIAGNSASSRWSPATPTSAITRTSVPISEATVSASSATGRSEVPAVSTSS